jgi:hypothetical protein
MSRQSDLDNHANQLNPNNDEYWNSRDEDRPCDNRAERSSVRGPLAPRHTHSD